VNSTLACSIVAAKQVVPVAHVEAGLRSGDLARPFPEEANRVLVDRLSRFHFAPTESARAHLLSEGTDPERIHVVGNTVVDALLGVKADVEDLPAWSWRAAFGAHLCTRLEARRERVVLVTGHRRESFGRGFQDLCRAIRTAAEAHRDWLFVYPVHLNPNVQEPVRSILAGVDNVALIEPLEYAACVWLMLKSDAILTDSGGMQEEGSALGKPLLVMREVTERPEAVAGGGARLVGTDPARILAGLEAVVGNGELASSLASQACPYGDGRAADRIVDVLLREIQPSTLELLAVA
jgi:UDP-N-acetylglucosamine 2-epimerase (non-hydrolysing)